MRTTVRVPLAGGVGAVVFDANSEDDVIMISLGDGPPHPVKASELGQAIFLLANAVKVPNIQSQVLGVGGPRFP